MPKSPRKALITGITGQDGSYLAELLVGKGYEVHGLVRRETLDSRGGAPANLEAVRDEVELHVGDVRDPESLAGAVRRVRPDELYHLSGPHFAATDDETPEPLAVLASGTEALLAALREAAPDCRFLLAGSCLMFGAVEAAPQTEATPMRPRTHYGRAKVRAHAAVRRHREDHGMFACTAILYNHESPRRPPGFVSRKIASAAARIKLGRDSRLALGNLDARRDWGYAPDYVEAMWRMLGADAPEDFVVATGETHTVRELADLAFAHVGLDYRAHVVAEPGLHRPEPRPPLRGDPSRIAARLGWRPRKRLADIVAEMVEADLAAYSRGRSPGADPR